MSFSKHQPPYLWMGQRFGVWLELTTEDTSAALAIVADNLCKQLHATVIDKYPSGCHDNAKEYWTLLIDQRQFMLMRLHGAGIALGARKETNAIVQIAKQLGVTKKVGWRWWFWDFAQLFRKP